MTLSEQVELLEKRLAKVVGKDGKISVTKAHLNMDQGEFITLDLTMAVRNKDGLFMFMGNPYNSVSDVLKAIEERIEQWKSLTELYQTGRVVKFEEKAK